MTDRSAIEWTQATWNPVTGCDRISPGCQHCYALTLAKRLKAMGQAKYQTDGRPPTSGPGFGVATHPEALGEPLFLKDADRLALLHLERDVVEDQWPVLLIAERDVAELDVPGQLAGSVAPGGVTRTSGGRFGGNGDTWRSVSFAPPGLVVSSHSYSKRCLKKSLLHLVGVVVQVTSRPLVMA